MAIPVETTNIISRRWIHRLYLMTVGVKIMGKLLTRASLALENEYCADTFGVSKKCRGAGYLPAFRDRVTGETHLSAFEDGSPAAVHILDGLPAHWVVSRDGADHVTAIRETVVSGFVRDGIFFTREEIANSKTDNR